MITINSGWTSPIHIDWSRSKLFFPIPTILWRWYRYAATIVIASVALVSLKMNIEQAFSLHPDDHSFRLSEDPRTFLPIHGSYRTTSEKESGLILSGATDIALVATSSVFAAAETGAMLSVSSRLTDSIGQVPNETNRDDQIASDVIKTKRSSLKNIDPTDHWRQQRKEHFDDWFEPDTNPSARLLPQADMNGPILDFLIVGFPKCGTTTLEANLGYYAPMPIDDVCTPIHQTVYYAYKNWPQKYGQPRGRSRRHSRVPHSLEISNSSESVSSPIEQQAEPEKLYRGSKCPRFLENENNMRDVSRHLPRTKLIVGIRHPVLWFEVRVAMCVDQITAAHELTSFAQSFWNMLVRNQPGGYTKGQQLSPYNLTQPCQRGQPCRGGCPTRFHLCLHRANFHVALARLGKTALDSNAELQWLVPQTVRRQQRERGDLSLAGASWNISNPIFVYEQTTLRNDPVWDSLAQFLGLDSIRHDMTHGDASTNPLAKMRAERRNNTIRICDAEYDALRIPLMVSAHDLSHWLLGFFLPVAMDDSRPDVVVHNETEFSSIVRNYQEDPCGRLQRTYTENGQVEYVLAHESSSSETIA